MIPGLQASEGSSSVQASQGRGVVMTTDSGSGGSFLLGESGTGERGGGRRRETPLKPPAPGCLLPTSPRRRGTLGNFQSQLFFPHPEHSL